MLVDVQTNCFVCLKDLKVLLLTACFFVVALTTTRFRKVGCRSRLKLLLGGLLLIQTFVHFWWFYLWLDVAVETLSYPLEPLIAIRLARNFVRLRIDFLIHLLFFLVELLLLLR